MKKQCLIISTVVLSMLSIEIFAQEKNEKTIELDEIQIDSRFKIKKENSGKIAYKITPQAIEKNKGKTIVDLINRITGIEINGNTSVQGQNLGYFIRGGTTKEVVILIDGLQIVNPLENSFDLRLLDLEQVDSIEITKGASSTLYGSGAATAVIDIRLKKAKQEKINTSLSFFSGTNKVQDKANRGSVTQGSVNINGRIDKLNYLAGFSTYKSDGFSAAKDETADQIFNDDPFRRSNVNLRLGYDFSDAFSFSLFGEINDYHNSYDADSFTDGDNISETKNHRIGIAPGYTYGNGSIHLKAAYTKYENDRVQTSFPGTSNGVNYMADAFIKHRFSGVNLIAGVNYQHNTIETFSIPFGATELTKDVYTETPEATITDPYVNIIYISKIGFNLNAGVRLNNHSRYGNHFVYNFNPSFRFKNDDGYVRFFGSYSTAFIAPSIQDLYASWGNPDLEPQESLTYEAGAEFRKKGFIINAVYFNRDVDNLIVFDPGTFTLINSGDTQIYGIEISTTYTITNNFTVNGNYTHTRNKDIAIRLPKNKANVGLSYSLRNTTNFSLDYQYVSDRDDTDFRDFLNVQNVTLASYSLLDFAVNHEFNKHVKVYFSATNLFNEYYQEVFGFSTRGRNFKLGTRFQF